MTTHKNMVMTLLKRRRKYPPTDQLPAGICDFTQTAIRQRLMDMLESLQIFALSCRAVAELTLNALDDGSILKWKRRLLAIRDMPYYDVLTCTVLDLIANSVPLKTIRTVYTELLRQLFWGNPLRGMKGDQKIANALLGPYLAGLLGCLENADISGFCHELEDYLLYELRDSEDICSGWGFRRPPF